MQLPARANVERKAACWRCARNPRLVRSCSAGRRLR